MLLLKIALLFLGSSLIIPIDDKVLYDSTMYEEFDYHKQMDENEYEKPFHPTLDDYFSDNDIRWNFCGETTILNVLDFMSIKKSGDRSGLKVVDLVEYFIDESGNMVLAYKNNPAIIDPNGMMSYTSIYWMADRIGKDTGLLNMSLIYGSNDSTWYDPLKKSDISQVVEQMKDVIDDGGVLIVTGGINNEGKVAYYHAFMVTDVLMTAEDDFDMLIIDSLGKGKRGYYGWVTVSDYMATESDERIYTGIKEIYGAIPVTKNYQYHKATIDESNNTAERKMQ